MSKKKWSTVNFIVSIAVVLGAFVVFSLNRNEEPSGSAKPERSQAKQIDEQIKKPIENGYKIETLSAPPAEILGTAKHGGGVAIDPPAVPGSNISSPQNEVAARLSTEMANQLKGPPPELPEDLRRQLEAPPTELPDDLKAQLNAPPPPLPDDIKRALETPPRVVSIDEVNGTGAGTGASPQASPPAIGE
jgi:hypothetical protein